MSAGPYLLHQDPNMIEVMEKDLITKITDLMATAQIDIGIHGVFSLDDLDAMTESDLCNKLAIGVAYSGAEDTKPGAQVSGSNAAASVAAQFLVVLAVPVTKAGSDNRLDGSKMLSVIRQKVQGTVIQPPAIDPAPTRVVTPRWAFVKELAQPSESSSTMLYYSQVWRANFPIAT